MKVTCQSCQAKYTIADEKVRGKVAKIRCKKCGTTIIVNGTDSPAGAVADYTQQSSVDEQWAGAGGSASASAAAAARERQ